MTDLSLLSLNRKQPKLRKTKLLGVRGETLAADFLVKNGYRLVVSNFKAPIGRNRVGVAVSGEIDLIAIDGETLCFIEVKTRRSEAFAPALSAVDVRKQRQITRTARMYRKIFAIRDMPVRFDAVTIIIGDSVEPVFQLTKGFWTESKFKKRIWSDRI
ncbi:MAG: YraN family protein [Pyrinomonadaceae bacterium]|nr:YraN family protein [Pyrinomonadaceae bacterium]